MVYIGNAPSTSFATVVKDTFNGGSTAYTLSKVATTNSVSVFVENVRQEPTTAYAVSGTTLTFTATTPSGTGNIYVLHMNPTTTTTHPAAQNLTAVDGTFTGNIDVDGTANLDVVDIDGALTQDGGAVFNEDSADVDFRVESNGDANMLFVEGETNMIGIKTNDPKEVLDVRGVIVASGDHATNSNAQGSAHGVMLSSTSGTGLVSPISNGANDVDLTLRGLNGGSFENRLVLDSDGDVTVSAGNLVIGTSGKGIDFSATADTSTSGASMSSELFDYYEEGTWTPTAFGGTTAGSFSATTVAGVYTRIGRIVYCEIRISGGSLSGAAGTMQFGGLPFTIGGTQYGCSGSFAFNTIDFDPSTIPVIQLGSSTQIYFLVSQDDTGWTTLNVSNFDSTFTLIGTFIYQTG